MVSEAVRTLSSWTRLSPVVLAALLTAACGTSADPAGSANPALSGSTTATNSQGTPSSSVPSLGTDVPSTSGAGTQSSSSNGPADSGGSSLTTGPSEATAPGTSSTQTNTNGTSSTGGNPGETNTPPASNGEDSDSNVEPTTSITDPSGPPVVTEPPGNDATQLYKKYEDYFVIGAAVDSGSYQDGHAAVWKEHFNGAVAENEMKWTSLQATEGSFNFTQAKAMVNAARSSNMLVRGHVLVWFDQTPDWVFQGSKEQVLTRMRTHITRVMQEFKGSVYAWDVVNEAVVPFDASNQDVGEDLAALDHWGYRDSEWYQITGEDFIFEAFKAARAADPDAKLFYNDFWNYLDGKREFILSFVSRLKEAGLIDGIGLQCHLNISAAQESTTNQTAWQTVENLEKEIHEYAALGLDVHITELDISIYTRDYPSSDQSRWFTGNELSPELEDALAARYKEFFAMFRRNADKISNVTFWGIADDNTWLSEFTSGRPDHPLLFDRQLRPKKAFDAITDF
jgi:endo-1,4-beta-xylanase